ncbi:MAG: hypothetical protein IJV15_07230 [Lachnospiraceae bacterium]|nr:hypothetical protein [Lachnospiraceae bacterium]
MRLRKLIVSFVCGALLVLGCGYSDIKVKAEEEDLTEEIPEEYESFIINESEDPMLGDKTYSNIVYDNIPRVGLENKPVVVIPYDYDGSYLHKIYYDYDENGNMTKVTYHYTYNDKDSVARILSYDENQNLIKDSNYIDGEYAFGEEYEYDESGKLTKSSSYQAWGISSLSTYEYDNSGRITKKKSNLYNTDSKSFGYSYYVYEYDDKGNMINETYYNSDSDFSSERFSYYYIYDYDKDGNMTKATFYDADNVKSSYFEYEYDGSGNMIKYGRYEADGSVDGFYIGYTYDNNNNLIKETTYPVDGDSYNTYYDYDNKGRVTKSYSDFEYSGYTVYIYDRVEASNMYRLYNPNSGEHFYTANETERDNLVGYGWRYEGIAWTAPETSDIPVYRLYNPNAGDHHYTISVSERDKLVNLGWKDEGIGWYSSGDDGQALYRLYNPNAKAAGAHHYTTSTTERDILVGFGWKNEGIAWYGE